MMLKKVLRGVRKIKNKLIKRDSKYEIGDITITLPAGHTLPRFQRQFKLYDVHLGKIAQIIYDDIPDSIGVDIGANVGDTAAIIRSNCKMPLICIEGHPIFFKYLQNNSKVIDKLSLINANVGFQEETIIGEMDKHGGTSAIVSSNNNSIRIKRLSTILQEADVQTNKVKLIKIDTDGFDFDIILGSKDVISESRASLYFEYDFFNNDALNKSLEVVNYLNNSGYEFLIFDNFGNFMTKIENNAEERFQELNNYLLSCRKYGGGIYYIDVFATCDGNILNRVSDYVNGLISN